MRWPVVVVLLGGCASSAGLERATYNAQLCEARLDRVQADAIRLRAQSLSGDDDRRAENARAWADKIAVDCRWWRDQVAIEQARIDTAHTNRMAAAAAVRGYGNAVGGGDTVHCRSRVNGDVITTNCN